MNITAGKLKGQKVLAPDEKITRPTLSKVRMAIFNTLQSRINFENKSFLDMFAGSGIMGFEAYSRGFDKIVSIEQNPKVLKILEKNYESLKISKNIIRGNSLKVIPKDFFDVIYIDPPYYSDIYESVLEVLPDFDIAILEHNQIVDFGKFKLIKQKQYGDKFISFLQK